MLRVLVACQKCRRQYDASGLETGSRFHCSCGGLVQVEASRCHDAAVVRCISCGGAREGSQGECAFCGSSFTLHEKDLHTVCPTCLTRCSDRGKFCHSCGTEFVAVSGLGTATDFACPVCSPRQVIVSRTVGSQVNFLECHRCAGMWMSSTVFQHIVRQARQRRSLSTVADRASRRRERLRALSTQEASDQWQSQQAGPFYRNCPVCDQMMHRYNQLGVVLDACRDHGIWFDGDEMAAILKMIEQGEEAQGRLTEPEERLAESLVERSSVGKDSFDHSDVFSMSTLSFRNLAQLFLDALGEMYANWRN